MMNDDDMDWYKYDDDMDYTDGTGSTPKRTNVDRKAYISKPDEWFLKMMESPAEGVTVSPWGLSWWNLSKSAKSCF